MNLIPCSEVARSSSATSALARRDVQSGGIRRPRIEASSPEPRRFPFMLRDGSLVVEIVGDEPNWLYSVLSKLQVLSNLSQDWDSYGGVPMSFEAATAALDFLSVCLSDDSLAPEVVPTNSGGVQLEWHRHAGDLEVSFSQEGVPSAFFVDASSDLEWEMENLSIDVSRLAAAVEVMANAPLTF